MALPHRPILRARTTALLLAAGACLAIGAGDPGLDRSAPAPSARIAPIILPEDRPPAPLRRLTQPGEAAKASAPGRPKLPSAGAVFSALAVVTLAAFGIARLWKAHGPKLPAAAPREAIEVLGRCRIESRQSVYLVRLGSRVLVLGSSGGSLTTLSEVTEALEVDLITAQCRHGVGNSSPFSRLFESRQKAENSSPVSDDDARSRQESPPARSLRTPAEQRLADRVRGRAADEETSRVA